MVPKPKVRSSLILTILMVLMFTAACQSTTADTPSSTLLSPTQNQAYAGKKVLFVNSYHAGYDWSDGIERGIHTILDNTGIELKIVQMDTKNHPDEQFRKQAGQAAKAEFDAFQPDIVIASDDNAAQYFIVPFLQESDIPVLFVGINYDASIYNFNSNHITGMIEIDPIESMMNNAKNYAKGNRVGLIAIDSETERKAAEGYNKYFFNNTMKTYFVKSFADFQDTFLKVQDEYDVLILGNNAGSSDLWDDNIAIPFFNQNTKIPTGSINPWMSPYCLLAVVKVPEEQGEWAGNAALRILSGVPVSQIAVTENKATKLVLNLDIAQQLGVVFTPSMLRNAEIYSRTTGK